MKHRLKLKFDSIFRPYNINLSFAHSCSMGICKMNVPGIDDKQSIETFNILAWTTNIKHRISFRFHDILSYSLTPKTWDLSPLGFSSLTL